MAYAESDVDKYKEVEKLEGRLQVFNFTFIGTIECYEDVTKMDDAKFRENILDLFDVAFDRDLKDLIIAKDDEGEEENQYKVTCNYVLKTRMDPNKYINEVYEGIVEKDFFRGALQDGFDFPLAPDLIRWEGKFKRVHQKDHRLQRKKPDKAKGLTEQEKEEDRQRREANVQKKEKEAARKADKDKDKAARDKELTKEYADVHYKYDASNPNYKKLQE